MPPFQDASNRRSKSVKHNNNVKPQPKKSTVKRVLLKRKAIDDDIGKENIPPFSEVSYGEAKKRKIHRKPASATAVTRSKVASPPPVMTAATTAAPLPSSPAAADTTTTTTTTEQSVTTEPSATTDINLISHRLKKNMTKITMSMVDDLGQSSQVHDKHVYDKIFESFVMAYAQKTLCR
ncbi:hypothetical protein BD770DRAFT_393568 [Pilaira anomala]|nr:hypothetical protein BD770DRAFT_393568 [Pilaira anomala]